LYDISLEVNGYQVSSTELTWAGIAHCKASIGGVVTDVKLLFDENGVYELAVPYQYGLLEPTFSDKVSATVRTITFKSST
jgi:hypothetical protein